MPKNMNNAGISWNKEQLESQMTEVNWYRAGNGNLNPTQVIEIIEIRIVEKKNNNSDKSCSED